MEKDLKKYKKLSRWIIWYEEELDCKSRNDGNCLLFLDTFTGNELLKIEVTEDKLVFSSYSGNVIKDLSRGEYLIKTLKKDRTLT